MPRYAVVPGIRLEAVGSSWAAYSPLSGETHLLNAESAVILDLLREAGPASAADLSQRLAEDVDTPVDLVRQAVELSWMPMRVAGLVRVADECPGYAHAP